jgi:hypothetical protein
VQTPGVVLAESLLRSMCKTAMQVVPIPLTDQGGSTAHWPCTLVASYLIFARLDLRHRLVRRVLSVHAEAVPPMFLQVRFAPLAVHSVLVIAGPTSTSCSHSGCDNLHLPMSLDQAGAKGATDHALCPSEKNPTRSCDRTLGVESLNWF